MPKKGVQSFFDEKDEPRAVLIDVRKNPQLWKTFRDLMLTDEETPEPGGTKNGRNASNARKPKGQGKKQSDHAVASSAGIAAFFEPGEKIRTMNGIEFLFDKEGNPKAVWIDLYKNPELWEDFDDLLVIRERRHEPHESFDDYKIELQKKLSRRSSK